MRSHTWQYQVDKQDQDSKAAPNMVPEMLSCLKTYESSHVGIVSPFHSICNMPSPTEKKCSEIFLTMTSGNLLNLEIYQTVSPFKEDLFIDFIDFDYYEKFEEQIMGLKYIKNHYGPTPIIFEKIVQEIIAKNILC